MDIPMSMSIHKIHKNCLDKRSLYLYPKWVDLITFAQSVQNILPGSSALIDITLTSIAVDLKSCHIFNIWWVEVQVST